MQQQTTSELQTLYQSTQSQLEIKESLITQFNNEREYIMQLFTNNIQMDNNNNNLDIKHEIKCLLNNYTKLINKIIERNEKEYSIQNDFNEKFDDIKQLLMDGLMKTEPQLFVENNNHVNGNIENNN